MPRKVLYYCDQIISPTQDIRLITLLPQGDDHLHFTPGQYCEVCLPSGATLPLSMANAPDLSGRLDFHLRVFPDSMAQAFLDLLLAKLPISLIGPYGQFTLNRIRCQKLLFLAGGMGFAPIQSLLTALLAQPKSTPCHVFWGLKRLADGYALSLLESWKKTHAHFDYTIAISEPNNDRDWMGERGWIHEILMRYYPKLANTQVFACGPQEMVVEAYQQYRKMGLTPEHFVSDLLQPVTEPL